MFEWFWGYNGIILGERSYQSKKPDPKQHYGHMNFDSVNSHYSGAEYSQPVWEEYNRPDVGSDEEV
jgi:hypothetical protein